MFDNYQWKNFELVQYYLYNYVNFVNIIFNKTGKGILFIKEYLYFPSVTQHLYNANFWKTLMVLFGPLLLNETDKEAIQEGHPNTDMQ